MCIFRCEKYYPNACCNGFRDVYVLKGYMQTVSHPCQPCQSSNFKNVANLIGKKYSLLAALTSIIRSEIERLFLLTCCQHVFLFLWTVYSCPLGVFYWTVVFLQMCTYSLWMKEISPLSQVLKYLFRAIFCLLIFGYFLQHFLLKIMFKLRLEEWIITITLSNAAHASKGLIYINPLHLCNNPRRWNLLSPFTDEETEQFNIVPRASWLLRGTNRIQTMKSCLPGSLQSAKARRCEMM